MREHARDVPQEEELADAKRPDIRVHCSSFDAPVPIEESSPFLVETLRGS